MSMVLMATQTLLLGLIAELDQVLGQRRNALGDLRNLPPDVPAKQREGYVYVVPEVTQRDLARDMVVRCDRRLRDLALALGNVAEAAASEREPT